MLRLQAILKPCRVLFLCLLGVVYAQLTVVAGDLPKIHLDTLVQKLETMAHGPERLDVLRLLVLESQKTDYRLGIKYATEGVQLAQELEAGRDLVNMYVCLSRCYLGIGQEDKSIEGFETSIRVADSAKEYTEMVYAKLVFADFYNKRGQSNNVLKLLNEVKADLNTYKINDKRIEICNAGVMGWLYFNVGAQPKAISNLNEGLALASQYNPSPGSYYRPRYERFYSLLGAAYLFEKKLDSSKIKLDKAFEYVKQEGNLNFMSTLYSNRASYFLELEQADSAEYYLQIALPLIDSGNLVNLGYIYYNLGYVSYLKNDKKSYTSYFHKTYEIAELTNNFKLRHSSLYSLKELAEEEGDYKNALVYTKRFYKNREKIRGRKTSFNVIELEKDKAELIAEHELTLRESELSSQISFRNNMILISLLTVLVLLVWLISLLQRNKLREQIAQQKNEVLKQKTKEAERQRIGMNLHDSVGGTLAGIKLQLTRFSHEDERANHPELEAINSHLDDVCEEVRNISHNLIGQETLLSQSFCQSLIQYFIKWENDTGIKLNHSIYPKEKIDEMKPDIQIQLKRIIKEALQNIYKHAQTQEAEIDLMLAKGQLNLMIEDRGKGMGVPDFKEGIGMQNINKRVSDLGGKLHIDTYQGRGTILNIDIGLSE